MSLLRPAAFAALLLVPASLLAGPAAASSDCRSGSSENLFRDHCSLSIVSIAKEDARPARSLGAKRIVVERHQPAFQIGDDFPVYKHNILMDPPRYGLPPVNGNWRYYHVEGDTYRVDAGNQKVLEIVDTSASHLLR
ncbi:hypothetical protein [Frigidibacter sp. MR17.24]|uniref:hypothetical protein n=1 Tax=Frigidibacter sp. MR17.24 TaxID=3127345 RepID=UPI00301313A2